MTTPKAPDNGLLAQPPAVRLRHSKDFAVAHTMLVEAKDRLLEAITESAPNSLIIVTGPTGVGKTTTIHSGSVNLTCAGRSPPGGAALVSR